MSNKMQCYTVYCIWKLLYMFRVGPPPIIRSANNCIYSIWYLSHHYCYLPLAAGSSNGVTNARCPTRCNVTQSILSGNCSTCFGWWYHPKHVEQLADKIECVTLHLVGHILEYSYNARTHER
jgi:hypothetical protein